MNHFRHWIITAFSFWILLATSSATANTTRQLPPYLVACAKKEKPPMVKLLDQHASKPAKLFIAKRCPGGLFLQQSEKFWLDTDKPFTPIGFGWWLTELASVSWQDTAKTLLKVRATYLTGIGPTGNQPFNVEINITENESSWVASEPIHHDRPFERPTRLNNGMLSVESTEQLEILGIDRQHKDQAIFYTIDFTQQRLIVKPVTMTSGSMRISEVFVYQLNHTYFLGHRISAPPIGTTDMKYTSLWYLLPKNNYAIKPAPTSSDITHTESLLENIQTGELGRAGFRYTR